MRDSRSKKLRDFRRRRWTTPDPYRTNLVMLAPRRALRGQSICLQPQVDEDFGSDRYSHERLRLV